MANEFHQDGRRLQPGERVEVGAEDLRDHGPRVRTTAAPTTATPPVSGIIHGTPAPAPGAPERPVEVESPASYHLSRDRVRWGPIIAGFLTALATLLLLSLLGLAVGLSAVDTRQAAAAGAPPAGAGPFSAIWTAVAGILAFLVGGYVAGKTAAVFDRPWGAFNGAMVFFLAVPATLWLAGLGLGSLLGTLGSLTSGLSVDPGTAQNAAQQAASQVSAADVARTAETVRTGAWGTLLGLSLALGASALGGALGTRRDGTGAQATGDGRV